MPHVMNKSIIAPCLEKPHPMNERSCARCLGAKRHGGGTCEKCSSIGYDCTCTGKCNCADRVPNELCRFETCSDPYLNFNNSPHGEICSNYLPGRAVGRPIQYIHVPKCGGTSVQAYLQSMADEFGLKIVRNDDMFMRDGNLKPQKVYKSACIFVGHRPFGWDNSYQTLSTPLYVITIREPLSLAISLFDYIQSHTHPTLKHVRDSYGNKSLSENVGQRNVHILHSVTFFQARYLYELQDCRNTSKTGCALEVLDRIQCIAVTDRLDDLIFQLRWRTRWLGIKMESFPKLNGVKDGLNSSELLPEALSTLVAEMKTGADFHVYQRARQLHMQRTEEARVGLRSFKNVSFC
jgi:hypothetical protein